MTEPTATPAFGQFTAYRLAARLARREVFRRPGRTLLVALLVALPVASMTVAVVALRTQHETSQQLWQQQFGQADASIGGIDPVLAKKELARLPKASAVLDGPLQVEGRLLRTVDAHRSLTTISIFDMTNPLARGIVQVLSGHAPTRPDEVFLTRDAAHQLGVKAGDTLRLLKPARRSFKVAGVGELATSWGGPQMLFPTGTPYPWKVISGFPQASSVLIKFAARPPAAQLHRLLTGSLARNEGLAISPALISSPFQSDQRDAGVKVVWSWVIGALVLTVVGIVIAAAFAVGARRQLVTLGQLAGNGAAPKVLRRVLFLQGTVTGIVGTLGGLGLGAVALALLAPHADSIFRRDVHPYIVRPIDIVPIIVLGVTTATVAALIPARAASRVPVLTALAGRRPLGKVPRWLPVTGAFVAAGGLALLGLAVLGQRGNSIHPTVWVLTAMVGSVAVLLGACAIAPFYVSVLEPAAARSRGSWRVATRSLARQRTRTSAVVSAIAATGALVIAASSLTLAAHQHNSSEQAATMRTNEVQLSGASIAASNLAPPAGLVADVAKALPKPTLYQLRVPERPNTAWALTALVPDRPADQPTGVALATGGGSFTVPDGFDPDTYVQVAVADPGLIADYGLSTDAQKVLVRHGALVLGTGEGHATLSVLTRARAGAAKPAPQRFRVPIVDGRNLLIGPLPDVLVTTATAAKAGMTIGPSTVVLRTKHGLTTDQRNAVSEIVTDAETAASARNGVSLDYQIQYPPTGIDPLLVEWLLIAIALVLTLFVVAVNLALSATETRDERDVLTIVGAAPGTMNRTNGYKAALLTGMGAILAIPVALLPVAVFTAAKGGGLPFVYPVWIMLTLVLALPLAAGVVTAAASALALRIRPVRISTMAFD